MSDLSLEDSGSEAKSEDAQYFMCFPLTVQVNTLMGTSFLLGVFPVDTVRVVKQRIGVQESLNPAHQHLLLGPRELGDHEVVEDIGLRLGHGTQLTLIMTLRGGPTPVAQRQRDSLLAAVQNRASVRPVQVVRYAAEGAQLGAGEDNTTAEFLEIVLVKCDGSVHVYYMPKPANPATRSASIESVGDGPNADSWAEAYYSESDEEDSCSEEANTTARAELTQQVAVENCKTRSRMVALQRKMAKKRQKRRKCLMKQTQASLTTARRKIPSPRVKPYSREPFHERAHQYPKTLGYMKATKRLDLLKAEMYLQSKRHRTIFGWSPYTVTQLNDYVTAKLHVLTEDDGYARSSALSPTRTPLTPTVLLKDPCTSSSSELGETESNRSKVQTARNEGPDSIRKNTSAKTSKLATRYTTAVKTVRGSGQNTSRPMKALPRRGTGKASNARSTTCFSPPFNEVPQFNSGHDNYGFDDTVETPRRVKEKSMSYRLNPQKYSSAFDLDPSPAESDTDAELLKSLSEASNRAGVKSARLKYKTAPSTGPESGGPGTGEQERAIELKADPEPNEPNINPSNCEPIPAPTPKIGCTTVTLKTTGPAYPKPSTSDARKPKFKSQPDVKPNTEGKNADAKRCGECKKRLTIVNAYECRCGQFYCSKHRYAEAHNCSYDYKAEGRRLIEKANPVVTAPKVHHI